MPRNAKPFTCYLCVRAGRESGPRVNTRCLVCADCVELFRLRGKRWCNHGRHMVDLSEWSRSHGECQACQLDRDRRRARAGARHRRGHRPGNVFFSQRNKAVRPDHPAIRAAPANQGFRTDQALVCRHLRLHMQDKFIAGKRMAQSRLHDGSLIKRGVHIERGQAGNRAQGQGYSEGRH